MAAGEYTSVLGKCPEFVDMRKGGQAEGGLAGRP